MAQRGDASTSRQVTVISLLRRTNHLMVDEITERLESSGFPDSPPSFHPIFENLDPEGTRLTVLAARAGLTHQSVGEVVTELERRGYVERIPDPTDKRARLVSLTDRGRDLVRAAVQHITDIEREWGDRWRAGGLRGDIRAALLAGLSGAGQTQDAESDGPSDNR
jgi:DNA-binding MarR family transcriptional regulator